MPAPAGSLKLVPVWRRCARVRAEPGGRQRSARATTPRDRSNRGVAPVRQSHTPPTARSERDAPHVEELTLSPAGGQGARVAVPPEPKASSRPSEWTASRIAALAIGALLVLVSLALLGGGGTGLWADLTQRDAGYVTTGVHEFSTSGSALAAEPTKLGSAGVGWLYSPGLLGKVRIRVTPVSSGPPLFVGIGRSRPTSIATSPGSTTPSFPTSSGTRWRPSAAARPNPLPEPSRSGSPPRPAPEPERWCGTRRQGSGRSS